MTSSPDRGPGVETQIDPLPPALSSMWRLCRLGYQHEPRLMVAAFVLSQLAALPDALIEAKGRLPAMLMDSLDEQVRRIHQLQADISTIERRLSHQMREIPDCKAIAEIPGVGLLTATAIVASMGTPTAFKDAREFAAWIGLVPRQTGTGGRVRQLGISKRGDAYLRTLLMHGARSIVVRSKDAPTWPWLAALLSRRPPQVK